jgi:uncharacterized protein (DUF488 family)
MKIKFTKNTANKNTINQIKNCNTAYDREGDIGLHESAPYFSLLIMYQNDQKICIKQLKIKLIINLTFKKAVFNSKNKNHRKMYRLI